MAGQLPPRLDDWPLTGRHDEMDRVRRLFDQEGGSLVLAGPAGVGKTRLAREALLLAASRGAHVHWVTATQATSTLPFSALAHLVPTHEPLPQDALSLFQCVAAALRSTSAGRRTVLAVDDAHLLDEGSAALVLHLANRGATVVVATVRSGEPCPDAVLALWKEQLALRLEVQALSMEEVRVLLEAVLGGPLEHATLWRLVEVTGGNPLFLRELVRSAAAGGSLVQVDGAWRWDGSVDFPGLHDLVRSRVERLPAGQRLVVELTSLGEPLPLWLLAQCTDEQELFAAEASGLLIIDTDRADAVRLAHPLYGEVLRGTMGTSLRRAHYRRLSEGLGGRASPSSEDRLRLASWSLEGGVDVPVDLLVRASSAAESVFDHAMAARLARAAVDAGGGVAAVLALAVALRGLNQPAEAERALEELEAAVGGDEHAPRYLAARTETLVADLGRPQEAIDLLTRARSWRSDGFWQDLLVALSLRPLLTQGRNHDVVALGGELVKSSTVRDSTRLTGLVPVGLALVEIGCPHAALGLVDAGLELAAQLEHDFPRGLRDVMHIRLSALDCLGQWGEMEALGRFFYEEANRQRDQEVLGQAAFLLGIVAGSYGRLDAARAWLAEAVGHLEQRDEHGFLWPCLGRLSQVVAMTGDGAGAARLLARAELLAAERPGENSRYSELYAAKVWALAAAGSVGAARVTAVEQAARFTGRPPRQAALLHEACRLGDTSPEVAEQLRAVATITDSPLHAAYAEHAAAADDGPRLDRVGRDFEQLGALLLAAEAAAEAAQAHIRGGDGRSARRSRTTAERLLVHSGGARTPALLGLVAPTLTSREREVAVLAAEGLSNALIGERLGVSERTVESHLYRACDKLGVHGRTELRGAL